MNNKLRIVRIV